mmetsp:Transcript_20683/g.30301  ORF Transcript_20683/g.30301 Transcript_20683/m.30301 type:complete len:1268 (-) Transcript_20683:9637-13440(-)
MPDEEDNSSGLEMDMDSVTVVTANTSKLTICDSSTILNKTVKIANEVIYLQERDMSVECGWMQPKTLFTGPVWIFAESIPSWLLMVGSYIAPTADISAVITQESAWFRRHLSSSATIFSSVEALISATCMTTPVALLLQGSNAMVTSTAVLLRRKLAETTLQISSIVAIVTGRVARHTFPWKLTWSVVNHKDYGGVTLSKASIGTLNCPSPVSKGSKVQRTLAGILKFDVGGHQQQVPPSPNTCLEIQVLPRLLREDFTVPSAYSSTGWVRRKLTGAEIGRAMDLPPAMTGGFNTASNMELCHTEQLLQLPPIKLVQAAASALTQVDQMILTEGHTTEKLPKTPLSLHMGAPTVEEQEIQARHAQAVKGDDVPTDFAAWDSKALLLPAGQASLSWKIVGTPFCEAHQKIFTFLRCRMTRQFARNATASFRRYLRQTYPAEILESATQAKGEFKKDLLAGRDALRRARQATFWEWDEGSTIFFWRWQPHIKVDTRDGTPLWVQGELPRFRQPQRMPTDSTKFAQVKAKIDKVRRRIYLAIGRVVSLTNFFPVDKGESDIRLVYDMTASGLNAALWAPTFWLPMAINVLDCACHDSWFGDIDAGDMFLNYPLDPAIRPYAGVDVSWDTIKTLWLHWTRMAMGLVPSPFVACRLFSWAMEIIKGDRRDPANPFHWNKVVLNLPGMQTFDQSMPRVYKWNPLTRAIASDVKTYVDDSRTVGPTQHELHRTTHQVETRMSYLGLQDATRKRRPESQRPGEWTGSITVASPGVGLFVTVSTKKWTKAKGHLSWMLSHFTSPSDRPQISLKEMEQRVGFLVHLAMAYPLIFPFLKGLYLTMNSWREGRLKDGWKMSRACFAAFQRSMRREESISGASASESDPQAPLEVTAAALMFEHVTTLGQLFGAETPSLRLIRGASRLEVCYFFGDASGDGFGASWWLPSEGVIRYRFGIWGREGRDTSSNYREFRNLVETLEGMSVEGGLEGKSIFLFTDNMVSESIASKGSSVSKPLYELVVRLFTLEMQAKCNVQLIHVAGTRMIAQGTDGLSRGDMYEGVMRGESMLSHVPIHIDAIERSPTLLPWVLEWASQLGHKVELLDPEGWFERGHDIGGGTRNVDNVWMPLYKPGTYLWAPPPAAGRHVIEEVRQARHKRQSSSHIVMCPRLMWNEWRRHVHKSADIIFQLPAGNDAWPSKMHEPLIFAVYLPYLHRCPWELRKTRLLVDLERQLRTLLKEDISAAGDLLSEFLQSSRRLDAMPLRKLRTVLQGRSGFTF